MLGVVGVKMTNKQKKRQSICVALHRSGHPNAYIQYEEGKIVLTIVDDDGCGCNFYMPRSEVRLLAKRINQFLEATK